jgi:uncharacterized protein
LHQAGFYFHGASPAQRGGLIRAEIHSTSGHKGNLNDMPLKASQRFYNRMITLARQLYDRLIRIRGTPHEIAMGMALGLYIGMTPLMGAHIVIAVFFAMLLKWNKLAAAIGVWVTNPVTALPIYGINYMVGASVTGVTGPLRLGGEPEFSSIVDIFIKAPEIFWTLLVGGMITGIPLAILGYYFTYGAVSRYQEDIRRGLALQKQKFVLGKEKITEKARNITSRRRRKKKKKR